MNEVICPNCKKAFTIDEAGYADILKQARDTEFEKQLEQRTKLAERDKQSALELAQAKSAGELLKAVASRDFEIQGLRATIDANKTTQKLAITEAVGGIEKERDQLQGALD